MLSKAQVEAALVYLSAAYPNFQAPEGTLQVYTQRLRDLEQTDLMEACGNIIDSSRFFPTIAEIRENAKAIKLWRIQEQERLERRSAGELPAGTVSDPQRLTELLAPARAHIAELRSKLA